MHESALSRSHLIDLLLVQVKDLAGGGGSNLLIRPVARLRAVPTVASQHKHHLESQGGRGVKEITAVGLSTDQLSFGCEATLTPIVMLHSQADTGTFLIQPFSLSTCRDDSEIITSKAIS